MSRNVLDLTASDRISKHFQRTGFQLLALVLTALGLMLNVPKSSAQAIPTVVSATSEGLVSQNPLVVGRDGTWSAVISNKSMWAFSDTKIGNAQSDKLISNSRAWTTNLSAANGIDLNGDYTDGSGNIIQSVPFTDDENQWNSVHGHGSGCSINNDPYCGETYAIWSAPIVVPPGQTPYDGYYFYKLLMRGGALPDRVIVGVGIAYQKNGVLHRPVVSAGTAHPTLMWQLGPNGESFTAYYAGALLVGNTLYMLSCDTIVSANHQCYEAKVDIANILDLTQWRYYNTQGGWGTNPNNVALMFPGSPNGSSIFYVAGLNEYMTVYATGNNNNESVFRVANQPWGPWSAETHLFTGLPSVNDPGEYDYDTQPHTEFQTNNGLTQYITYVQHNLNLGQGGEQIQIVKVIFSK